MSRSSLLTTPIPRYFSAQVTWARRFHLPVSEASGLPVHVVGGGREHCRPDYDIQRATFPCPILEFVVGGAGAVHLAAKTYALVPGSWFTYGPGLRHRIRSDPDHPLVKYFIMIAGPRVGPWLRAHHARPGTVARVAQPDRISAIIDDLIAFGLGDRSNRVACCARTLDYLILKLADLVLPGGPAHARAFQTYQRCRQYMEAHAFERKSLEAMAMACGVDKAYLCRLFQRFGRKQPQQYLQHIRMNHALTQLQTTDRLIKEIGWELGFSDPANFTRAFRRWFGVPPQTVRDGHPAVPA